MSKTLLNKTSQVTGAQTPFAKSPAGQEKTKLKELSTKKSKEDILNRCESLKYSNTKDINSTLSQLGLIFNVIAPGSGRVVFDYDDNYVLKFAVNINGLAQNVQESKSHLENDLFANVKYIAKNGSYLISEKVTPFSTQEEFYEATGIAPILLDALRDKKLNLSGSFFRLTPKDIALLQNKKFMDRLGLDPLSDESYYLLMEILDVARITHAIQSDMLQFSAWGTNANGELKCLDYGLRVGNDSLGMNSRYVYEQGRPIESKPIDDQYSPTEEEKQQELVSDQIRSNFAVSLPKYEALYNICRKFFKTSKLF
jgi:hypothetical protein